MGERKYLFQVYKEDCGIRYLNLDPIHNKYVASTEEIFLSWKQIKAAKRAFKKWKGFDATILMMRTKYIIIEEFTNET